MAVTLWPASLCLSLSGPLNALRGSIKRSQQPRWNSSRSPGSLSPAMSLSLTVSSSHLQRPMFIPAPNSRPNSLHNTEAEMSRVGLLKLLPNKMPSLLRRSVGAFPTADEVLKEAGSVETLTQLKNGMRVASVNNQRPTTTVGVWIESGSHFETAENNGVASFFERLIYSGTAKRDAQKLQLDLATLGARLNSYTSRDATAYFAECMTEDVDKVVEILADVMINSKIEPQRVEEVRREMLAQLEELDADHGATVMENLYKTAYQGTTYALSPYGSTNSITKLTREDIIDWADDNYKPVRMVMAGVGGVEHDRLEKLAEKHFGHLENNYKRKTPMNQSKGGVRFTGSEFLYRDDDYPYMFGAIAMEGVPRYHIDALALQIASIWVGQWDGSQAHPLNAPSALIQKLCTNTDLVSFESFCHSLQNTGLFGVYFVTRGHDLEIIHEALSEIQKQWKYLAYGLTEQDVDRAKNQLKTNLLQVLETNTELADHVALEVMGSGKITPLHTLERKIHYADANAVREAMSRHVYDRDLACAGVGKTEAWPVYHILRSAMSWWRL